MPAGRPTKMTTETIGKLEQAFLMGCTDLEACLFADISKDTLYDYQRKNPEFINRKDKLKKNPVLKARQNMLDLMDSVDDNTKYKAITDTLNRYDGKPADKVEVSGKDGGPIQTKTEWTIQPVKPIDET